MSFQINEKYIVGPKFLQQSQKNMIVYAAGIADDPSFEEAMGAMNVSVHAFDCTIPSTTQLKNGVEFHHWCIGQNGATGFENNGYSQRSENKTFQFLTLSETKAKLGHAHIHILKMDIEGFEWDILQHNIIDNPNSHDLPDQILVEIHAIGANKHFVPEYLSRDKTRAKVNALVRGLWSRGYRVVSLIVNPGDRHCADVTFLRVVV